MRETGARSLLRVLLALLVCAAAGARAENTLRGLEMDVMEPGESAAHATSRIVLPPPVAAPESEAGLDPEQRLRVGGPVERELGNLSSGDPALGPGVDKPVDPGEGIPGGDDNTAITDPGTITSDPGGN
jgi:hypothetical protein